MPTDRQKGRITRNRTVGHRRTSQPKRYAAHWADTVGPKAWLPAPSYTSLSEAPDDLVMRAATEKLPWIQRFLNENCPRGMLERYARKHAESEDIPAEDIPPYKTLNTWVHQYRGWGLLGLVDSVRGDAGKSSLDADAEHLVEVGLVGGKKGYSALTSFVARHTRADKDSPKYHSIYRRAKEFERKNPHLLAISTDGRLAFKNRFRLALTHGLLPGGHTWSVDSTVADIWVRIPDPTNPHGWKPARPVLTVVEDLGSRMFLTFNLSLFGIDSGTILSTFQRAVDPAHNYPGLYSFPLPRRVAVDKGSEHRGDFLKAMKELHVEVVPGAPNDPEARARLERLIGSVSTEVFAHRVGYSRTERRFDAYAPPEADTKRTLVQLKYEPYRLEVPVLALPRLPDIEAAILAWATTHNDRPHPGLPADSPELRRLIALTEEYDSLDTEAA